MSFSLGEWMPLGSRLTATGVHALGLGVAGAIGCVSAGMIARSIASSSGGSSAARSSPS